MKQIFAILMLATLAACGADGEPVTPSFSGTVNVSSSGIDGGAGVKLRKGGWTIGLGLF